MKRALILLLVMSGVLLFIAHPVSATIMNWVSHQSSLDGTGLVATIITLDQIPEDTGGVTTEFRSYYRVWLGDYQHTPTEGQTYGRLKFEILDGDIKSTGALFGGPYATRPCPTDWGLGNNSGSPWVALWPFVIAEDGTSPTQQTGPREWNGEILSVATDSGYWVKAGTAPSYTNNTPVPEPSTLILLGSGLAGLIGYGRRRFKK